MQVKKTEQKSKIDEMQGVIEEHRTLQAQYEELKAKNIKLCDELTKAKKDIEMFEPYREFVTEASPKVWAIELTNKYAIDNLRKLERKIYGGQLEVLAKEQEELMKPRTARMNKLVEKMIHYVCLNSSSMNIFIRKMIREPGENV
jgi:FtsZ-binding cell division protein ZapB